MYLEIKDAEDSDSDAGYVTDVEEFTRLYDGDKDRITITQSNAECLLFNSQVTLADDVGRLVVMVPVPAEHVEKRVFENVHMAMLFTDPPDSETAYVSVTYETDTGRETEQVHNGVIVHGTD